MQAYEVENACKHINKGPRNLKVTIHICSKSTNLQFKQLLLSTNEAKYKLLKGHFVTILNSGNPRRYSAD